MKISVGCGCYVGQAQWKEGASDWVKEPDECTYEETIVLTPEQKEEWNEGCFSMDCPKCGAELTQDMDHFQAITENEIEPSKENK